MKFFGLVLLLAALVASRAVVHPDDRSDLTQIIRDVSPPTATAPELVTREHESEDTDNTFEDVSLNPMVPTKTEPSEDTDDEDTEADEKEDRDGLVVRKVNRKETCASARGCPLNTYCCYGAKHCCLNKKSPYGLSYYNPWA
ncbi:hypothetical protein P170DRAFT_106745 [Aspergillus steynii IBT 23096]|uniref:WAP domain-containing protein n=1 Tax=Aspergillus steynii IBT 23096 TaxID=1392250 RepID=A0A2I2GI80_9EURO|nr:uncharacterized protein P170DRAFT_106745 [Aspergillus steynii IBT 23096]PLB52574.1 hypothetical protein P170DRAFT_106745 [Aspergillus steynii IBT 23096]